MREWDEVGGDCRPVTAVQAGFTDSFERVPKDEGIFTPIEKDERLGCDGYPSERDPGLLWRAQEGDS